MEWMITPLKRYADFEGRSRRLEYWMFTLGYCLLWVIFIAGIIAMTGFRDRSDPSDPMSVFTAIWIGLFVLIWIGLFVPSYAVQARRFHDQDRSGWMVLLGLIPYVGWIVVFVFMCLDGTRGPNSYGEDPKGGMNERELAATFE